MLGRYVLSQFARPHGRVGSFFAAVLNRGNSVLNGHALEALQPREGDRVLDIGFGGGATLEKLLNEGKAAFAGGLDASPEMVQRAEKKLAPWIQAGRLEIRLGTAESLPWPAASFDRLLSVNSIYYWHDPLQGVKECFRVLRPGGTMVLGLRSKAYIDRLRFEGRGYHSLGEREAGALLESAGFSAIQWASHKDQGGAVVVQAVKPGE